MNTSNKGLEMYFSPKVAKDFADLEQNQKHRAVSDIVDRTLLQLTKTIGHPLSVADLGGGAHPDRYDMLFQRLLTEGGHIDWVDISPYMLDLAQHYLDTEQYKERKKVLTFVHADAMTYLAAREDKTLDAVIMKYTLDYFTDLEELFGLLAKKMTSRGVVLATIGTTSPDLKSYSTNARYLYNGESFPDNETRTLQDGDSYTVKFFRISGDPTSGFLEGAETVKYYHAPEKIKHAGKLHGFDVFLGDWKELREDTRDAEITMDQIILVLKKQ